MAAQHGNGVWKWISGILASVLVAGVVTTTGAWFAWGQQAQAAVGREEVEKMVDREIGHVNESIGLLRDDIADLRKLVVKQGGG